MIIYCKTISAFYQYGGARNDITVGKKVYLEKGTIRKPRPEKSDAMGADYQQVGMMLHCIDCLGMLRDPIRISFLIQPFINTVSFSMIYPHIFSIYFTGTALISHTPLTDL